MTPTVIQEGVGSVNGYCELKNTLIHQANRSYLRLHKYKEQMTKMISICKYYLEKVWDGSGFKELYQYTER